MVYLFNFGRGLLFEMWSSVNINISLLVSSPQRTEGAQTSGQGTDRCLQSAAGCRHFHQTTPPRASRQHWRLERPPICLRLVRVNHINPCPFRFKAETAHRRIILRLPSSIRQVGGNAQATRSPPLFLVKIKRPPHVWIFGLTRLCANLLSDLTWAHCWEMIIITDVPTNTRRRKQA